MENKFEKLEEEKRLGMSVRMKEKEEKERKKDKHPD